MWDWVAFCNYIFSWLPIAYKNLFSLALYHFLPILKHGVNIIGGLLLNDKIVDIFKHELERIEESIHQADKVADAEGDDQSHGTREKIKQLIEASFRIQDAIDEYIIREEQLFPFPGFAAGVNVVKKIILPLQIAYDIYNIKSKLNEIKDTSSKTDHEGSSSSVTNQNTTLLQNLRKDPFKLSEVDVVGFENPRDILIDWLLNGRDELTVVAVVAMGGQGKTTLAKNVFDRVKGHFDYHVWITVSQSYNIEELLRELLKDLCEKQNVSPPQNIHEMNKELLVDEVSNYLQEKRYVVVFDDVWNSFLWADIKFAISNKQKGCRILITTRHRVIATSFREYSLVKIHELKGLDDEQSLKLFNKKAFYGLEEVPPNLIDISSKIVKTCGGLPLAIVVTGGLLSVKDRSPSEWCEFYENLKPNLEKDSLINQILVLSYHDLPYNLKSCLLYFGIYPEDCKVDSKRLIRQWIAEGFVKEEEGMTLEEVAEGYLTELIHRSLVHVVSLDGRAKRCRVHNLVHVMILEKFEDLSFCKYISEDGQSTSNGVVRRLSITTNSDNLMKRIVGSQVQSLLVHEPYTLDKSFVRQITTRYRLLKVFDAGVIEVPEDLGSLNHLRYFSINTGYRTNTVLPKSIGMLKNLETLDLTGAAIYHFPKEICKLKKLRHFLVCDLKLVELKDGIGEMTSLQTLSRVCLNENDDEDTEAELIEELGKLKQLKELGLRGVMRKHMIVLSSSINKMQQLKKLSIQSSHRESIDLDLNLPKLQYLKLNCHLEMFPEWIKKLQNLVELFLSSSQLTNDQMKLLGSMPNLLSISLSEDAYVGVTLHFENEWFMNLKELHLYGLDQLKYIHIDQGALPSLERMDIKYAPRLKRLPTGIQHLKKLQYLDVFLVSREFIENIKLNGGKDHLIFKQVSRVQISEGNGQIFSN